MLRVMFRGWWFFTHALTFVVCLGCERGGESVAAPRANSDREPGATNSGGGVLEYEVELQADMERLFVSASFPAGTPGAWSVDPPAMPYVEEAQVSLHASARRLAWDENAEARCEDEGCRVTYSFLLGRAARELADRRVADNFGDAIIAPSSTWLLRPRRPARGSLSRYQVRTPPGLGFGTGTDPVDGKPGAFESPIPQGFHAPYAAFGPMRTRQLGIGSRRLSLFLLSAEAPPREDEYIAWIERSARAVGAYYGEFPAEHTAVFLLPFNYHGSQMGIGGASVVLGMNAQASPENSGRLWVAAHEMVHVGFPGTPRRQKWASEGLATYVETVARAQAGLISEKEMWELFVRRLPEGQPGPFDQGLDVTRTWARTYWGGALFWFVADVEISRATGGRLGLREALRGLIARGGNTKQYYPFQRTTEAMDASVGVSVVQPLYARHARAAVRVDLESTFERLGVRATGDTVQLDDAAPEAYIRHLIEGRSRQAAAH